MNLRQAHSKEVPLLLYVFRSIQGSALLFQFLLVSASLSAQAPLEQRVRIQFSQATLEQVFQHLEEELPLRFYFKSTDLPKTRYDFKIQNQPLEQVLDELLRDTGLGYSQYRSYAFIIGPSEKMRQSYSADFYAILEDNIKRTDTIETEREIVIGSLGELAASGIATITGSILDAQTKEPIIGATILWENLGTGTSTDALGAFETTLPPGKHQLKVQYIGYSDYENRVHALSNGTLLVELEKTAISLNEVLVKAASADANVENVQIGGRTIRG